MKLRHLDLFSGIGGFSLAARWLGIETTQFVEINPFCQKVLAKNFPGVSIHDDITTFTAKPGEYDIITAGFPCQDISSANVKGRGLAGERSGLFFEVIRIVCQCRPRYIVLENVKNLLTINKGKDMGTVLWELAESGYDAEWQVISAASVGAPHLRERLFVVAYANIRSNITQINGGLCKKNEKSGENWQKVTTTRHIGRAGKVVTRKTTARPQTDTISTTGYSNTPTSMGREYWRTEPGVGRVVDGFPGRMDRIKALGNAVLPQCAIIPLQRVIQLENEHHG